VYCHASAQEGYRVVPTATATAAVSKIHPKGALRRCPHGRFFSSAITPPSSSIRIRLPIPTKNISAISNRRRTTHGLPRGEVIARTRSHPANAR